MKLYEEIIPKLMAKYHFTDKDTITDIIENIITDELDREKFKLAMKYPNGLPEWINQRADMKRKLKYQSGKNEYSILNVKTKNISKLEVDKDVEEVVSNSPYFKKIKLGKKLDELNCLGMNDQTIAGTLGIEIRTIRMFRKSPESMRPTTLERVWLGVDEIKKQLEELGKQT